MKTRNTAAILVLTSMLALSACGGDGTDPTTDDLGDTGVTNTSLMTDTSMMTDSTMTETSMTTDTTTG